MARKRDLAPSFFTNEELFRAEQRSGLPLRVAYAGLWGHCDREGRFEWNVGRLKLGILPWDNVDFEEVLRALVDARFVLRYEVGGVTHGCIPTFLKWQSPHPREAPSKIPPPASRLLAGYGQPAVRLRTSARPVASNPNPQAFLLSGPSGSSSPSRPSGSSGPSAAGGRTPAPESDRFAEAMALYPARPNNSRQKAWRAWQARVREGVSEDTLLAGTRRYAGYVQRERTEPRFVKLACTFYGPDRHFENDYGPDDTAEVEIYDERGEMTPQAARALGMGR